VTEELAIEDSGTAWRQLDAELDRWQPGQATFWWRDDDAVSPGLALDRLLGLGPQPLALAVIPAEMKPSLPDRLTALPVDVLQHGFAHHNHEPPERKKAELGDARPADAVLAELAEGWRRLGTAFGKSALPVLVPPWNRISDALIRLLPESGYRGLSTYGPRQPAAVALPAESLQSGVVQVNTHVDIIDWRTRRFRGLGIVIDRVLHHLQARREGHADAAEPTGLLTHHLAMDDDAFAFTAAFLERTARHPAVQWLSARDIFTARTGFASE
jgi:hypothetical protein